MKMMIREVKRYLEDDDCYLGDENIRITYILKF